ncbi:hypothetical protein EYZ11_001751 [Aspergillus tanneri]|uniref:Xylose isomerase-like TIM barrel domain-containing protein n=1 Tax=Aspergillus tanneri TaxID=1220188 RepID=A0A4S3JSL6_9EURO|nr:uncharacterized protein ATNIH1004_000881 [Aspergillus tanneri]KAA8651981.1 hypothetical protein ATNIH1004_000881 [Aspergillus tanneri]THC98772.1 hypothetical protein EYZ11_001751 [Aspergillus tanneri]
MSLGLPGLHHLPDKLHQAAQHNYQGIELFFSDLEHLATTSFSGDLVAAAHSVHRLCHSLNLSIICLQPFLFYEGLLDRTEHSRLLSQKLPQWFQLAHILHTDLIQIPSNFLPVDPGTGHPRTTGDRSLIVSDLQRIADLGLQQSPPIRFVYEALAWANHIDTWEECYAVVLAVDRPNFGICLDSFNLAARVYADPTTVSGKTPDADAALSASLARLRKTVDPKRVFYVQIVDGERLQAPLTEDHPFHVPCQPARMSWSRNARLFAFEEDRGGYLPVVEVARSFFDIGFDGWVSLELFSRTLADPDKDTPRVHARRGYESWRKLVAALDLNTSEKLVSVPELESKSALSVQHRL